MAKKKDTVALTFRLPTETLKKLDELCAMSGQKRSEYIIADINADYDKVKDNPQLKEFAAKLKELNDIFQGLKN